MRRGLAAFTVAAALSTGAFAQTPSASNNLAHESMNPAARGRMDGSAANAPGTRVPGATSINPYNGKSVGMPLQPNDLGSPEQKALER